MIDIKFIIENTQKVKKDAENKGVKVNIDRILELNEKRKKLIGEIENLKAEKNKLGPNDRDKAKQIKNQIKESEPKLKEIEQELNGLMMQVPNLPLEDVPVGKDESENQVTREEGHKVEFGFTPKNYLEIAEDLDIIDTKRAAKVSGTRFGYLKGDIVLLEFALVQLALNTLIKDGFVPVIPPVMLKSKMVKGMGYLEQMDKDEAYYMPKDDLYLAGTSEQAIGSMHADEIFDQKELPKRYAGFSTCFRREAGSYGKDTKGILRVHQFDKVEMFSFTKSENSIKEHNMFLSLEEKLMKLLKIPYRVVNICTGDLGYPAASKYDIESWMPGQNQYRETHSTSNCTDFQSRRLNIRYKDQNETRFVHTVNGTAFAIGRTLIAIIENYQQKDGTIKVPKVLQKYAGIKIIK